ncbi:hypothetical protein GPJ56_005873 [Histomonas meleagridis]|uniref:uncharacterized protein n=1 Tax=Histomonas meleagridis TaxID=135588 RepID=UPI0035594B55|nr:hypothetical protein GPJ56_005873 [Histomonas meleagridis]KAH0798592.1 hypothetical protein GO595_008457 [Histomonas meleagridis]
MFPLVCAVSFALLLLTSKQPINCAFKILDGLKFIILSDDAIKTYHIPDKVLAKKSKSVRNDLVEYYLHSMTQQLLEGLPYLSDFQYLWTTFLTGVGSEIACLVLGLLPIKSLGSQINMFYYGMIVIFIILIRFGISTSFNRRLHRRFAVGYSVIVAIIIFFLLRQFSFGIFEFRPILLSIWDVPPIFLDIFTSILVGFIAYSLSTPMLYELFIERQITNVRRNIPQFQFAIEIYLKAQKYVRKIVVSTSRSTVLPFLILFLMQYLYKFGFDTYLTIAYVVSSIVISIMNLKCVHTNVQLLTFTSLHSVAEFDEKRSFNSGRNAQASLQRSLLMIPVSAMSLSMYPMMKIVLAMTYTTSFVMKGVVKELARRTSLFAMMITDLVMAGNKIFSVFMPYE